MTEEGADTICYFGRQGMLEFAGLLRDFVRILDVKSVGEEAFCEAMAADDILRAPTATLGQ
jgi:hypothetical protein